MQPTNTLEHRGYKVTGDVIGYIAWYSIADPKISAEKFKELMRDNGLNTALAPKKIRSVDAFKRACRNSERKKIPIGDDKYVNLLIRAVSTSAEETERHIVREVVDQSGKRLSYLDVAKLKFDRENESVSVSARQLPTQEENDLIAETIRQFKSELHDATNYLESQVIRNTIRNQLKVTNAVNVRSKGSVYFIPVDSKDIVVGLEGLCEALNSGSVFHSVPLLDTSKQREMVKAAFEADVHQKAAANIAKLQEYISSGRKIGPKAWQQHRDELNRLVGAKKDYKGIVDHELTKADVEIQALKDKLEKMLVDGHVTTK